MTLTDPPAADEFELSLLGPGKGESVVLHVGESRWAVVDSCAHRRTGESAPLKYLRDIGVDPAISVDLVVASHAHDDHVRGIADLIEACPNARFGWPAAASSNEFFALLGIEEVDVTVERVFHEYRRVVEAIRPTAPMHLITGRQIELRPAGALPAATILCVAPSDQAVTRSRQAFAGLFPTEGDRPRRLATRDPNEFAAALWLQIGDLAVLLGSDLLVGPAGCGWGAVLVDHPGLHGASVFKVPHHGAPNAHHAGVWTAMLAPNPIAVLTPYRAGRAPRPDPTDRTRICDLTNAAYITARPGGIPASTDVRGQAARLRTVARNVREVDGEVGHVRVRCRLGDPLNTLRVDLARPARGLCA